MSFLSRILGLDSSDVPEQVDVVFGRFTDAYKTSAQVAAFDRSLERFEQGAYLDAYREFFASLKDPDSDNITVREENDTLYFEFWQGSQRITGMANAQKVKAESKLARTDDLNVGFLRRLVTANFSLKFSRFALDSDNCLCMLYDTSTLDGSPLKINFALRELAINADKQDDLLLDEFRTLRPYEPRTYGEISESEKEIKYAFIIREINQVFAEIDAGKPDPNQYPGTYAYLLLALAFKLDYLVRPEGWMMDAMERIHGIYFAKNDRTAQTKINSIRKEYQQLLDRPKEDFFKEMYRTRSTFGVNPAVNHGTISALIDGELSNMEWPLQQRYETLAMAVPRYIAGFALFHYAPPKPDRHLFHLFFKILEPEFFKSLGFKHSMVFEDGRPDKTPILREIKRITEQNKTEFPHFKPNTDGLDFNSMPLFAKSFLLMVKDLNLSKPE
jgi:hypothetical protein